MAEYIDRQAVLDDLANLWDWETVDGIQSSTVLRQVMTDVRNVPTADVRENVHGHWDTVEIRKGEWWHTCSECKATWGSDDGELYFKFCPNCGADNREDTDG